MLLGIIYLVPHPVRLANVQQNFQLKWHCPVTCDSPWAKTRSRRMYYTSIESVLLIALAAWLGNLFLKKKSSLTQTVNWSSRLLSEPPVCSYSKWQFLSTAHWFSASPFWVQLSLQLLCIYPLLYLFYLLIVLSLMYILQTKQFYWFVLFPFRYVSSF